MPVLRERKIPPEYIDTFLKKGGCVKIGSEIWYIQAKRLQIGVIESVDPAGDNITVITKGKPVKLNPMASIVFTEPFFKIPKDLKALKNP